MTTDDSSCTDWCVENFDTLEAAKLQQVAALRDVLVQRAEAIAGDGQ
jgi:hypothetical protein